MHNLDWLAPIIFWLAVVCGFFIGVYTGIVSVISINRHIKQKRLDKC